MAQSIKDCPVLPSYVHANIGETSCVLTARPDLVKMTKVVDEKDYKTFFDYIPISISILTLFYYQVIHFI